MVLVNLLSAVGSLFNTKSEAEITNAVFKLHYMVTTSLLFTFCVLVTARVLVGDPINCLHEDNPRLQDDVVNTYCWIHTTFTLPKYLHKPMGLYKPNLYPGIGIDTDEDEKIYHSYYQWVPFALFFQGLLFYIPYWLWRAWEGKRMSAMCMGLSNPVLDKEERKEKITVLADYLVNSLNRHQGYAYKFIFCEILNFINVTFNIWFLDKFLGGMFFNFGVEVLSFINKEQEDRTDPLIILFPRVTKCTFHMFGVSGTIEKHDLMCVLALNIINEKIYIFLWFWFIFVAIMSILGLIFRVIVIFSPAVRVGIIRKRARLRYKDAIDNMVRLMKVEDYFILHFLSKNIELMAFNLLIEEIHMITKLRGKTNGKPKSSRRSSNEAITEFMHEGPRSLA